jgi:heme/copper-type cytochrome/quinol oxidase subunit 4
VFSVAPYTFTASAFQIAIVRAIAFEQVDLQVWTFAHFHQQPRPEQFRGNSCLKAYL